MNEATRVLSLCICQQRKMCGGKVKICIAEKDTRRNVTPPEAAFGIFVSFLYILTTYLHLQFPNQLLFPEGNDH